MNKSESIPDQEPSQDLLIPSCLNSLRTVIERRQEKTSLDMFDDIDIFEMFDDRLVSFVGETDAARLACKSCKVTCDFVTTNTGRMIDVTETETAVCVRGIKAQSSLNTF
jgi:hypothetical protein